MDADPLRAAFETRHDRRAALHALLAGDDDPPAPADPGQPPAEADPPPKVSPVTQGVRTGLPGPAEPTPDDWLREAADRRGAGGYWTVP